MPDHNGLDGKLMTIGEPRRFVPDGLARTVRRRRLHDQPQPDAAVYEIARPASRTCTWWHTPTARRSTCSSAAGCVRRLDIAYGGNGPLRPHLHPLSQAVERGEVLVEDYTNNMNEAASSPAPWACRSSPASRGSAPTVVEKTGFPPELARRRRHPCEKVIVIDDPFGHGGRLRSLLLPALTPDVSIQSTRSSSTDGTVAHQGASPSRPRSSARRRARSS